MKRFFATATLVALTISPAVADEFKISLGFRPPPEARDNGTTIPNNVPTKTLHLQYIGNSAGITINSVSINRGAACFWKPSGFYRLLFNDINQKLPATLHFGGELEWRITCNPIEVVIDTDIGRFSYNETNGETRSAPSITSAPSPEYSGPPVTRSLPPIAAVPTPPPAAPTPTVPNGFKTPSGNIFCVFDRGYGGLDAQLRCDISHTETLPVPRPRDCQLAWGDAFEISETGNSGSLLCHDNTVLGDDFPTLPYGTVWRESGMTCKVETTGLVCINDRRHGFMLSRSAQRLF